MHPRMLHKFSLVYPSHYASLPDGLMRAAAKIRRTQGVRLISSTELQSSVNQ